VPHPRHTDLDRLAHQVAGPAGYRVVGVQIQAHRIPLTLVVQLRRDNGGDVDLDDCAAFSGALGDALEATDVFPEPYVLEISSPGVGEELSDDRDFRSFRGFPVEVRVRIPGGPDSLRQGLLLERDDEAVHLNIRGRVSRIPRADVLGVRLITPQG
jgi:ribosome maturation factor RimP